jgi:hypothetical protein
VPEVTREDPALAAAFAAAASGDPKPATAIVPRLVREKDAAAAQALACALPEAALPEAFMLFATPGLAPGRQRAMIRAVFSYDARLAQAVARKWAACTAAIGRYGFSFPQWRFVMQGFEGAALAERYGMERLRRATDTRDAALPPADPARDRFGAGFVHEEGAWTIEYRRAYILCANRAAGDAAALVIRNSSYFFGRDRLPFPAYIAWQALSGEKLAALEEKDFAPGGAFTPWHKAFTGDSGPDAVEKLRRARLLLDRLDSFDGGFSGWLRGGEGLPHLAAFLRHTLARAAPPFYLAAHDPALPPWFPKHAVRGDAAALSGIEAKLAGNAPGDARLRRLLAPAEKRGKFLLLSGPAGDFPLRPQL